MNVVVVSSSKRFKSTSRTLMEEMVKGIKENNNVEIIDISKMNLEFCRGCLACQKTEKCIIDDDVKNVIGKVNAADILVFTTPIYYYSISGQLKTFLDRMNPLYVSKDRKFKKVYALFTCADDAETAVEGPIKAIEGFVECFPSVEFVSSFNGFCLESVDDISEEIKEKAYIFGKNIK